MPSIQHQVEPEHTDEIQEIITAPPSWLLQWGITLFFAILILLIGLSTVIRYPDTIKTQLKINSNNSPKPVIAKIPGRLVRILVDENQEVKRSQVLAYVESVANHEDVLQLLDVLMRSQKNVIDQEQGVNHAFIPPVTLQLGELQGAYQSFYQSYLTYNASIDEGYFFKKRAFLQHDLEIIQHKKEVLLAQKSLQEKEYELERQNFHILQKLVEQKAESYAELKRGEERLLSKEYPLQLSKASLIENAAAYSMKKREILELDNQINEEKLKFTQAQRTLISEIEAWKSKYVLSAPHSGIVTLSGIVQVNQNLDANQEVFHVNPGNPVFFGELTIPQLNMGKVVEGQKVVVRLKGYSQDNDGIIGGTLQHIATVPVNDSVFLARVMFDKKRIKDLERTLKLKNGMIADAEIITKDETLFDRLLNSSINVIK